MQKPGRINHSELKYFEQKKLRVTIKGFFYNKMGEVFFFHREGRMSLPGGGVDEGEKLHEGFVREVQEELHGVELTLRKVRDSLILKIGTLPTTKLWWKGKRVYVLAVYLKDLENIAVKDSRHHDFRVLPIAKAIAYIQAHEGTSPVTRKFYVAALRRLARLKKWKV